MGDGPLWWPVQRLIEAYRDGSLSPVEVAELARARIAEIDPILHAFVLATPELSKRQAAFHVEGHVTTLGSLAHAGDVARHAGAVFVGKTNVPEFCQSATTDNLLGPGTTNPFDPGRTAGGSSGGAAASVASGTCTLGLGSDGGGSIRIPAAFCGLVGLKPTYGAVDDAGGIQVFSPFISAGPLARCAADARVMYSVLSADSAASAGPPSGTRPLRLAWCANPEGRPVDTRLGDVVSSAVHELAASGHHVSPVELDLGGWEEIFGPLVLAEEGERRGHLLDGPHRLTRYQERSLRAAGQLDPEVLTGARSALVRYRVRVDRHFRDYDVIATPATATPAFELGRRPKTIAGRRVGRLWGAFPFATPFNVSGHPAIVVPAGFVDGLPVAIQLVGRRGADPHLLSLAEQLEAGLDLRPFVRLSPSIPSS